VSRPPIAATLVALALVVASCAVPTSDSPTVIAQDDLDESLRSTTTSTSEAPVGVTRDVEFFVLKNNPDNQEQRLVQQLVVPVEVPDPDFPTIVPLISPLFEDDFLSNNPVDDFSGEYINQVGPEFNLIGVRDRDPDAGIDYHTVLMETTDPNVVPSEGTLRDAIAQLVFTLTALPAVGVDGAVRFEINGQLSALPTSDESRVDTPVARCDYYLYDPEGLQEPCIRPDETTTTSSTTTSTSTSTTTTVAPSSTTTPAQAGAGT